MFRTTLTELEQGGHMFGASRTSIAASWALASELTRRAPDITVYETHPGGGQYDCLTLATSDLRVDVNRVGSLHVIKLAGHMNSDVPSNPNWVQEVLERGVTTAVDNLCEVLGIPLFHPKPATSPRVLQYRVIARALAGLIFDEAEWDVRSAYFDSSGMDGSNIVGRPPSAEMMQIPANELWRLLRNGVEVAWMWDGWAWNQAGERRNLMSLYDQGADIDSLVGLVTARAGKRSARVLPDVEGLSRQPVGSWPQYGDSFR